MTLRGIVDDIGQMRTVSTQYGERELVEVTIDKASSRGESDGTSETVTLWGKWAETADILAPGMTLVVTNPEEGEYRGERQYSTTGASLVVVEPDVLVNVTDVRNWVQCPRMYYLNKLSATPLAYPVVKGTIIHEVFGDLLRGRERDDAIDDRIADAGLELGLLGRDPEEVHSDVEDHVRAIEGWLAQGVLTDGDEWRSERTLIGERVGIKGRADAIRRGMPVELKTGKNTTREPRFEDKVQAACYALLLEEQGVDVDTGTLLYTKNAALDRGEATGDLSPAKEFSIGTGLLSFVVRTRNEIAAMEFDTDVPTGYEADATCEYCFEQDTCLAVSGRLAQESKAGQIGSPVPPEEREYFDQMYRLLEEERRAVHRSYARLWVEGPEERAASDRALIDLEPTDVRQLDDGRWELRAEPTGATSKIREGDRVLASDGDPIDGDAEPARVERLGADIVVTTEEPIDLRRLDVYPSEFGIHRAIAALSAFVLQGSNTTKDVFFGRRSPTFRDENAEYVPTNAAQDAAVNRAVNAEELALIHGPPGTGKTYTIACLVQALLASGERVLLSAYTNRAVDNALEALRDQGIDDIVRLGTESGVRTDMQDLRLPRRGDPETLATRLREAPLVAATTTTCGSREARELEFDVAVVDEASQLTEPDALAAITRADRVVLVGDHCQLPPVVRAENDLSRSLFERLIEEHPDAAVKLERQYRMAQAIQAFPSKEFYEGTLRPATSDVAGRNIGEIADREAVPRPLRAPVSFHHVESDAGGNTDANEAARVAEIVEAFESAGVPRDDLGVIAPFRAQVAEITTRVPDDITVDTVDRFQGSSKDVIIVSFVASGTLDGPLFEDERRLNVALTRAKRSLVLVGDRHVLESRDLYARMIEWADRVS